MKVEIWSDVICPFCYIGKRKLESALARLPQRERVEIAWKSFQLQPDVTTDPTRNAVQHLAERKGWSLDFARQAAADVSNRAKEVGLAFDYDRTVVANTFDAHRLSHYAATRARDDDVVERLFKAYFTEGRNIADHAFLTELAVGAGLPEDEVRQVLASGLFGDEVRRDIDEAMQMAIGGVPFFVFDGKYAVSGAQDSSVFLEALTRSLSEWTGDPASASAQAAQGDHCDLAGRCAEPLVASREPGS
jgi:predicted DsbA family dithiol-disulfide isomerase